MAEMIQCQRQVSGQYEKLGAAVDRMIGLSVLCYLGLQVTYLEQEEQYTIEK